MKENSAEFLLLNGSIIEVEHCLFSRSCPECKKTIFYRGKERSKVKDKCRKNHIQKKPCQKCNLKNRKIPDEVKLTGSSSYKTFAYWTKEEEEIVLNNAANLSVEELVLLVPRHSLKALRIKAKRLGVSVSKELKSKLAKSARQKLTPENLCFTDWNLSLNDLSNKEYQLLVGSMLGDGCCRIHKSGRDCKTERNTHAQYYEGHGKAQTEYLKWKMPFFEKFKPRLHISKRNKPEITTCTHPIFSEIRNLVYKPIDRVINGQKVMRMEKSFAHHNLIQKLDEFGLLIWYLDDGFSGHRTNKGGKTSYYPNIAIKSMDIPTINKAIDIINKKLGLSLTIYESKWKNSTNRVIKFGASNRDIIFPKWQKLALEHNLPKSMWYKLGIAS